jgi:hypothetical protein
MWKLTISAGGGLQLVNPLNVASILPEDDATCKVIVRDVGTLIVVGKADALSASWLAALGSLP